MLNIIKTEEDLNYLKAGFSLNKLFLHDLVVLVVFRFIVLIDVVNFVVVAKLCFESEASVAAVMFTFVD